MMATMSCWGSRLAFQIREEHEAPCPPDLEPRLQDVPKNINLAKRVLPMCLSSMMTLTMGWRTKTNTQLQILTSQGCVHRFPGSFTSVHSQKMGELSSTHSRAASHRLTIDYYVLKCCAIAVLKMIKRCFCICQCIEG